ncbi:MAG: helix-hairpin-helix domain-containing protein [Candidatus Poseidoniaceae archaeon]
MANALGERDIPFVLIGISAVTVLLVTWLAAWYWALLAVAAIVGGGFLWSRVLGRADQPTPDLMSAEPGFMRGAGTPEEPYVLRSSRMVPPGGMVQSEEIIRIAHLVPGSLVRIRDANEDANLGRFSAVTAEGDAPPSLDLKADLEGNIAFRLVFNDSAQMTLEGGSCTFDGRVGREEVRVHWEAHLKEDRAYVEALAAFESNQVRRTGERASIMARYEADIAAAAESKDKDKLEAKARDARAESEEAIVEEERVERAALDELTATSREAAAATAAEVEAEMDGLVEAAKAKQVEQELMLEEARAFEEAEAAAREEAKALKQAQKALKRAERQAEAEAAAAEAGEDETSEASEVDELAEEALRADKEERIEREIAEQDETAGDDDEAEAAEEPEPEAEAAEEPEPEAEAEAEDEPADEAEEAAPEAAEEQPEPEDEPEDEPADEPEAEAEDEPEAVDEAAEEAASEPEPEDEAEPAPASEHELTDLKGVGPAMAAKLNAEGVMTVADLASLDDEGRGRVGDAVGAANKIDAWCEQAQAWTS